MVRGCPPGHGHYVENILSLPAPLRKGWKANLGEKLIQSLRYHKILQNHNFLHSYFSFKPVSFHHFVKFWAAEIQFLRRFGNVPLVFD